MSVPDDSAWRLRAAGEYRLPVTSLGATQTFCFPLDTSMF